MIIVEGTDLVGKTTFCNMLQKHPELQKRGMTYAHATRLPSGFNHYQGFVDLMSRNVIQDRFYMSEIVYALVRGEQPKTRPEVAYILDAHLRLLGGYTVIMAATSEDIKVRWRDGEMYNIEQVLEAGKNYDKIVTRGGRLRTEGKGNYIFDVDYAFDNHSTTGYSQQTNLEFHVNHVVAEYAQRQDILWSQMRVK